MRKGKIEIKLIIRLFSALLFVVVAFFLDGAAVQAEAASETKPATVYTRFTSSSSPVGTGTRQNPYNYFSKAFEEVADGGTIVILEGTAYLADQANDGSPFVLDKSVTIQGDGADPTKYTLNCRYAGIVLGSDATFKNMSFNLTNMVNPGIYANGHVLVLENTSQVSGTRIIDIYAGGLHYNNQMWGTEGTGAEITISGTRTKIGDIFSGGKSCDFAGDTTINLKGSFESAGTVYGSGEKGEVYGDVVFNLEDSNIREVNGLQDSYGTMMAYANFKGTTQKTTAFSYLYSFNMESGSLAPSAFEHIGNLALREGAVLNLRDAAQKNNNVCSIGSLYGFGGTLQLGMQDTLEIAYACTGDADVEIIYSSGGKAPAETGHTYIDTSAITGNITGSFTLISSNNQSGITLSNNNGQWQAVDPTGGEKYKIEDTHVNVQLDGSGSLTTTYDGNRKNITINVQAEGTVLKKGEDYELYLLREGSTTDDLTSAGTVEAVIMGKGNYTGTVKRTISIAKKTYTETVAAQQISHIYTESGERTVKLSAGVLNDVGKVTYKLDSAGATDAANILLQDLALDENTGILTYELAGKESSSINAMASIPITVSMTNYSDVNMNVVIALTDKEEQKLLTVNASSAEVTYGKTITLSAKGGSGDGEVTYRVDTGNTSDASGLAEISGNQLKGTRAGTISIIATKAGNDRYKSVESAPITITIGQVSPAITPFFIPVKTSGITLDEIDFNYKEVNTVAGRIVFVNDEGQELANPDVVEIKENTVYKWIFLPDDSRNYASVSGTIIPWKYDASDWRNSLQSYYQQQQQERRESRQEHDRKWREHMNLNPSPW